MLVAQVVDAARVVSAGASFIHRQQRDWKVTVARTSLDKLAYQMVFPYQSIYILALGATATHLGMINSAGMAAAALFGPITGWLIDRIGAKRVYVTGIGMLIVCYLAYSIAGNWLMALAAVVAYWLGFSTSILGCATVCGNCLVPKDRATGMMICETVAAGLLGMAGPLVGAWIVARSGGVSVEGIRPVYMLGLVVTIISFVLVATQLSDRRYTNRSTITRNVFADLYRILQGRPHLKRWLAIASVGQVPMAMVFPFSQVYAHEVKGADVYLLGTMVTACAMTSIIAAIPLGRLADRVGRKRVLYVTIPLFWASNVLLVLANGPAMLVAAGVLQGFFFIGGPISGAIERELVPSDQMGRWLGIARLFRMTVNAGLALLAGIIWDTVGAHYVFLIFVAIDVFIRAPLLAGMPETLRTKLGAESGT